MQILDKPVAAGVVKRSWLTASGVPFLLLLIVIAFYWKLVLTSQFDWVRGPDLIEQVLPWFDEESRQLHQGTLPLWDPHTWAGQPTVGQAQPGAAYPLNWVLFAMPRAHGHIRMPVMQWYYVIIHYMAALFCYLLCRDLGRSRLASVAGGLVFGLGGYVASVDWPQMVNGAVWIPLVLLFLLRAVRDVRPVSSAALSGLFLGMAWLSGHHQVPIFLTLTAAGTWLFFIVQSARPRRKLARLAALAMLVTALAGALQILPATEYGHLSRRWASAPSPLAWNDRVPYSVHSTYSLSPVELFGVVFPGMAYQPDLFTGVAAFSLALLALGVCWRDRAVRLFGCLALAGVLYALGRSSVFQGFLYAVIPMLEKARTPRMATFVFSCAIAVLAAFGVDRLAGPPDSPWPRRISIACGAFGAAVCALIQAIFFANNRVWTTDDRVGMLALAALLFSALLYAWRSGALSGRQAQVLAVLLIVLELGTAGPYMLADRGDAGRRSFLEKLTANRDIAAFLGALPRPFRIESEGELATNWGEYHDVDFFRAMTPSVTANLFGLEFHTRQTRRLFNVRYALARKAPDEGMREVFTAASGMKVYEDPGAFPRAWTVHQAVRVAGPEQGRELIREHLDDLRAKAFLTGEPPALASCPEEDHVAFAAYQPGRVVLRAAMSCRGMLVVSDTMFPGWKASVDGLAVPVHEVNFGMRGVVVPAGLHEVQFVYRPWSVYIGFLLTLSGVTAAIALAVRDRRLRYTV